MAPRAFRGGGPDRAFMNPRERPADKKKSSMFDKKFDEES